MRRWARRRRRLEDDGTGVRARPRPHGRRGGLGARLERPRPVARDDDAPRAPVEAQRVVLAPEPREGAAELRVLRRVLRNRLRRRRVARRPRRDRGPLRRRGRGGLAVRVPQALGLVAPAALVVRVAGAAAVRAAAERLLAPRAPPQQARWRGVARLRAARRERLIARRLVDDAPREDAALQSVFASAQANANEPLPPVLDNGKRSESYLGPRSPFRCAPSNSRTRTALASVLQG